MSRVWIAVGGNIGDTEAYIHRAIDKMANRGIHLLKSSHLIRTKPYGNVEQDDFINGVLLCETGKLPVEVLDNLLEIEKELGRVRLIRWGPRTIDLDILYYDDVVMSSERLLIPHPEIQKRAFVLEPLVEISPEKVHPVLNVTSEEMLSSLKLNALIEWFDSMDRYTIELGLDNIRALLSKLGNSHNKLQTIHVAGTNGKGSVTTYMASVLKQANYSVGVFNSPFIQSFRESFKINDEYISDVDLIRVLKHAKKAYDELLEDEIKPTYFEILTAMAFLYFYDKEVDFAIIEVGMGGLYDATNVIDNPLVSVITRIGLDHTGFLGDTIEEIASQKAGIIKENCPVIAYDNIESVNEVILATAKDKHASLSLLDLGNLKVNKSNIHGISFDYDMFKNVKLSMLGSHQAENAALSIMALEVLRQNGQVSYTREELYTGLNEAFIRGRLQLVQTSPLVLVDGAHNVQAFETLVKVLDTIEYKRLILVIAMLKDKDYSTALSYISTKADIVICTEVDSKRTLSCEELFETSKEYNENSYCEAESALAYEKALKMANKDDLVLVTGSFYLLGEVIEMM